MKDDKPGGPIRWRLHVGVPPAQVFEALDSEEGRAAFWAESAVECDGHIEFRFIEGTTERSRILRREKPRLFSLEYFGAPVRFELSDDGNGGTDLLLTHEGVAPADWLETHAGWLNVLFPLKAYLMHGIDLRNHDPSRSWNGGYVDQ